MSRPLYALLLAAPLAVVADWLRFPSWAVFGLAALGVVPLAGLIGAATEELSIYVGPKYGGLLNATFGNAAELIITILAIRQGLLQLVKASLTGSIIGNTLLILGLSLLVGGIKHGQQRFDREEALHHITLLALAISGLLLPALFAANVPDHRAIEEVSLFTAGTLLVTYIAYIGYSLFRADESSEAVTGQPQQRAVAQDAVSEDAVMQGAVAKNVVTTGAAAPHVAEHHVAAWSKRTALLVLAGATAATVFVSELLVRTVEPVTQQLGWSEFFVGIIIVPLIGNAAEHFSAITFALKNRMDVTMAIAAGSSTQIALFVAPLLVFLSLLLGNPLDLVFHPMELLVLGLAGLIFAFIALDGRSTWLEGVQLLALYLIVGVVFFFLPTATGVAPH